MHHLNSKAKPASAGTANLAMRPDGIISISFEGRQTGPIVDQLIVDLRQRAVELRRAGKSVNILIDISGIHGHDSSSRSAAKVASTLDFDRGAAYGGSVALGLVMQYLQRSIDPRRARYYRTQREALDWLSGKNQANQPLRRHLSLPIVLMSLAALAVIGSGTYIGWYETTAGAKHESKVSLDEHAVVVQTDLQKRFQVYINALYSFRGLYMASDTVGRTEFRAFFNSLNIVKDYPGFNSISYVQRVKNGQKNGFIASVRADKSLNPKGYPNFHITPDVSKSEYQILTYVEPSGESATMGFDLSSNAQRNATFVAARDSGLPVSSGSLELLGANPTKGFLIAMPIYDHVVPQTTEARQQTLVGYVNAVFNYEVFFTEVLKQTKTNTKLVVQDSSGQTVFTDNHASAGELTQKSSRTIDVGGQTLTLTFSAPAGYGLTADAQNLPRTILVSAAVTTILVIIVMIVLLRSRGQAIFLANTMTEDLEHEKANVEQKVKERTRELGEAHAQLAASIQGLPFGFAVINLKDQILFANSELSRLVGWSVPQDSVLDRSVLGKIRERYIKSIDLFSLIAQAQSTKKSVEKTIMIDTTYVRFFTMPITMPDSTPEAAAGSRVIGTVLIMDDVTEEKALQRSRDEFFSIASHELRTPLTAIVGNASLMTTLFAKQLGDPTLHQMVADIEEAGGRLIDIVNDFLDMSRLEQGQMAFRAAPVDLGSLTGQVLRQYQPLAAKQKLKLKLEKTSENHHALGDEKFVHQILGNLLANALKFTAKGTITIRLETSGEVSKISVVDTGQGIPAETQHLLFHKFQQATSDILTRDNTSGTGVGLYISELMAKGMKGKLYLASTTPGKGSTFTLELPSQQPSA